MTREIVVGLDGSGLPIKRQRSRSKLQKEGPEKPRALDSQARYCAAHGQA
jgi:hypothetical protein